MDICTWYIDIVYMFNARPQPDDSVINLGGTRSGAFRLLHLVLLFDIGLWRDCGRVAMLGFVRDLGLLLRVHRAQVRVCPREGVNTDARAGKKEKETHSRRARRRRR